jgi:hypothetical protein
MYRHVSIDTLVNPSEMFVCTYSVCIWSPAPTLTLSQRVGNGMLAVDHRPFTTHVVAPFPAGADYTMEGMKCSTLRLPHVVAADLRLCNHHQPLLLQTRLHHPPTPTGYNDTYLRPHHDNLHHTSLCTRHPERAPKCDARHPDAPTSRSTTSLPIATLWSSRHISNLHPAPAPLHLTYEVAKFCDKLGLSDYRKCSRHHKSR